MLEDVIVEFHKLGLATSQPNGNEDLCELINAHIR